MTSPQPETEYNGKKSNLYFITGENKVQVTKMDQPG